MAVFGLIRDAAEYFGNLGRVLGHRGDARLFLNKASPAPRFRFVTFERVVKFPLCVGFVQNPAPCARSSTCPPNRVAITGMPAEIARVFRGFGKFAGRTVMMR